MRQQNLGLSSECHGLQFAPISEIRVKSGASRLDRNPKLEGTD